MRSLSSVRAGWVYPLIVALWAVASGCSRTSFDEAVIARVNGETITAGQFRNALLRKLQSPARIDTTSLAGKIRLLNELVDERLMVQVARQRRLDGDPEIQRKVERYREQALVSKLVEREVVDKVIPEGKLKEFYRKYAGEIRLRYILLRVPPKNRDAEQKAAKRIRQLWQRARAGESFAQLAREASDDGNTAARGGDLGYVRWGSLPADFQEQAFVLDVGELSNPIRGKAGYYLLKLEDRIRGSFEEEKPFIKWQLEAVYGKTIRLRRQAYFDRLLKRYEAEFHRGNYKRFASLVTRPRYPFEHITGKNREIVLASFRSGKVTVGDIVDRLGRKGANYRWDERNIDEWTRTLVSRRIAVAEAQRQRIDVDDAVREYEDRLLLDRIQQLEIDRKVTVQDSEMVAYFEKHRSDFVEPEMFRVREILVRDPVEAEEVARQAKAGKDFVQLAREHTVRPWARKRHGDLGYFPASRFPEIAQAAQRLHRKGEVAGPISVAEGFSVIQFLGRRPPRPKVFKEAREKIRTILIDKKRQERREQWLRELRQRASIEIDKRRLQQLFPQHRPS